MVELVREVKLNNIKRINYGDLMEVVNIKNNDLLLTEYIKLCNSEWGSIKTEEELEIFINNKKNKIINGDKVISVLGLIDNNNLIGFISLFKYDGDERHDLSPWYATMFVKKEYRKKGYSKILNDAILIEAKSLGYDKVYLKTDLVNYYEKFGAKYIEDLNNGEKLYYIDLNK